MRAIHSQRRRALLASVLAAGSLLLAGLGGTAGASDERLSTSPSFSDPTKINNPYLPISDQHRCVLAGKDEGTPTKIVRTLQDRTKTISYQGGTFEAVVVKDRSIENGRLGEKTLDYFAQSDAGTVYYLGEDVNTYNRHGQVTGHGGAWLLGRDTQTPGILMPADPKVGDAWVSEDVPGITHESDSVVSSDTKARIGGHIYHGVIRVREDAGPPPEVEFKHYARGDGVITEANGGLKLVDCR